MVTPQFYGSSSSQLHSEPRSLSWKLIREYPLEVKISLDELPVWSLWTKEKKASETTLKDCSSRVLNRVNIGGKPIVQSQQKVQSILYVLEGSGWIFWGWHRSVIHLELLKFTAFCFDSFDFRKCFSLDSV